MMAAMSWLILYKLLAMFCTAGLGYAAARLKWLGTTRDPARSLSDLAFAIFVPALLFRTTARLDFAALPWRVLGAFFIPAVLLLLAVYGWQRRGVAARGEALSSPAVRALSASYGNSVQVGIPLAAALFGEQGLGLHITLVSLHSLVLLTLTIALAEGDLVRAKPGACAAKAVMQTVRSTLVHPVVLPVLLGLAWNATGLGLHPVLDEALSVLGLAVVPICLVLIGLSLAQYGLSGKLHMAARVSALKLLLLPAAVLATGHWVFGLHGMPLAVVVMMAAMPVGTNALILGQRYDTLQAEATAAIVLSTVAFVATAAAWLAVLSLWFA